MFYLGVLVIVAVVFGVLSLSSNGISPSVVTLPFVSAMVSFLPMGILGLVWLLYKQHTQIHRMTAVKIISQLVAIVVLASAFGLKSSVDFYQFSQAMIDKSVMVTAHVRIDELSDSRYSVIDDSAYRQKAYLTNIQLAHAVPTQPVVANPFGLPALTTTQLTTTQSPLPMSMTVLLTAYPNQKSSQDFHTLNELTAGYATTMTLRLSALPKTADTGFDARTYLLSRHIHAQAQVLSFDENWQRHSGFWISIQQLRQHFRDVFLSSVAANTPNDTVANQAHAVTLSLLTGDRALIDQSTKALYQWAGISHLLAISGAHVLFLAVMLASLVVGCINRFVPTLYHYIARWQIYALVMLVAAFWYALFVGADFPAMRTVYFLLASLSVRYLLLDIDTHKVLISVGLLMIYIDPMAIWQAGFWLSFVASALLVHYGIDEAHNRSLAFWRLVKLQLYLFVAMLPISVLLFGKVSVMGLLVNLLAVGLFGLVIVPINLLAGVLYAMIPSVSLVIWAVVDDMLATLHQSIGLLMVAVGDSWISFAVPIGVIVLVFLVLGVIKTAWLDNRFVLLPIAMIVLALFGKKATNQLVMINLPSSQPIYQTLMTSDTGTWLILSKKPTASLSKFNHQRAADELYIALKQHNINRLTGIIVQTADDELATLAGATSLAMPVYELWYAGDSERFGTITAKKCTQGRQWRSDDWQIVAMTGFDGIFDPKMHTCQLMINSQKSGVIHHSTPIYFDKAQFVIHAPSDDKLWQVWALLCGVNEQVGQVDFVLNYGNADNLPFKAKTVIDWNK